MQETHGLKVHLNKIYKSNYGDIKLGIFGVFRDDIKAMKPNVLLTFLFMISIPIVRGQTVTVNFTDANSGPSDTLQIGGVNVSSFTGGFADGQPTTVLGSGLGIAGIGPAYEINRQMYYAAGSIFPVDSGSEGLDLQVDGSINSFTVLPSFRAYASDGSLLPLQHTFQFGYIAFNGIGYADFDPANPIPLTFQISDDERKTGDVKVDITADLGEHTYFIDYRQQNQNTEETFMLGLTVQSLTYTPAPEPSSLAMFGVGFLSFVGIRKLKIGWWLEFSCRLGMVVLVGWKRP